MTTQEKINRNEFLKKIGFSGAALFTLYTLDSCQNESNTVNPTAGVTLNLNDAVNAGLKTSGGFVVTNGIVVANSNGSYIAATVTCSHEGNNAITFRNNEWTCSVHGARFSTDGKGLNTVARNGLRIYTTTLNGTTLTVNT